MQFLPPRKFKKTLKCYRCTKRYALEFSECPHCVNIKDGRELEIFVEKHKSELRGNQALGFYFMLAGAFVLLIMILFQ